MTEISKGDFVIEIEELSSGKKLSLWNVESNLSGHELGLRIVDSLRNGDCLLIKTIDRSHVIGEALARNSIISVYEQVE